MARGGVTDTRHVPLSQDAALVVALAGTAMSFAHSAQDEAERWLRALRLHGEVGAALQALGVGEAPLASDAVRTETRATPPHGAEILDEVTRRARQFAAGREADTVGTRDLLYALFEIYGKLFDQVLYFRGTSREELVERLAAEHTPQASRE
jgi:hypothetical protein